MKFLLPTIWKKYVLGAFFPHVCFSCQRLLPERSPAGLCIECSSQIVLFKDALDTGLGFPVFAVTSYSRVVSRLLFECKFNYKEGVIALFVPFIESYFSCVSFSVSDAVLVPIPLHPRRLRRRGFNQSLLLAHHISRVTGVPCLKDVLCRQRYTTAQSSLLDVSKRAKNILDCFRVVDPSLLSGKTVILVDDVLTTGATVLEAARVVRKASPKGIIACVLAKT